MEKATAQPWESRTRRKFKRATTLFSGTILCDGRSIAAVVLDVSVNGAKVRLDEALESGTHVKLRIDRLGEFRAEVVWCKQMRVGLKFLDPPDEIARLMPDQFATKLAGGDKPR